MTLPALWAELSAAIPLSNSGTLTAVNGHLLNRRRQDERNRKSLFPVFDVLKQHNLWDAIIKYLVFLHLFSRTSSSPAFDENLSRPMNLIFLGFHESL